MNPPAAPPLAHSFTHPQVIIANGHFVVLGWSERTLFLLAEAAQMLSDRDEQGGEIVVLTELDEQQMLSEVNIVYPDWRKRWPNVVLRYMQGKPYEIADLMRVSVFAAHHVMVLGLSRRPREADSQVITMLCALRCLPISMSPQCLVVAEMRQSQAKSVARQLFISTGEEESAEVLPVAAAQAVDALLVMCTVSPLAGRALMGLMSFAGDQVEIVRAAGSGGVLIGRSFGEARRCFPKGVLIGLIRSEEYLTNDAEGEDDNDEQLNETGVAAKDSVYRDRERVRLAPPDEELILASDSLVVLAEDQADAAEGLQGVAQAVRRDSTIPTTRWASISLASIGKIAVSMSNLSPTSKTKAAFAIPSKDDPDATPPATPTRAPAPSPAAACAAAAAHAAHAASASAAATFAASTSAAAFASASARAAAATCAAVAASAASTFAAAIASASVCASAAAIAATTIAATSTSVAAFASASAHTAAAACAVAFASSLARVSAASARSEASSASAAARAEASTRSLASAWAARSASAAAAAALATCCAARSCASRSCVSRCRRVTSAAIRVSASDSAASRAAATAASTRASSVTFTDASRPLVTVTASSDGGGAPEVRDCAGVAGGRERLGEALRDSR